MNLDGKVALVTGGSRGIGAAVAKRLAGEGAAVALTYVSSADKAEAVAKEIEAAGGTALVIHADSADPEAVVGAVERTAAELGGLDILVNNAGVFSAGPFGAVGLEELERVLAVDVKAVFVAAQAAVRHLGQGGRIITIGSAVADHMPVPGMTLYTMAKSALVGLTKGLARDLGPLGIRVSVVHPGLIDTDMNPADAPEAPVFASHTALGAYGTAEDVAVTVAHLAGEGGRYVTGAAISVDGGFAA